MNTGTRRIRPVTALLALLLTLPALSAKAQDKAKSTPQQLNLSIRAEVWQMPQLTALDVLDQAREKPDATGITLDLRKRAKEGETDISLLSLPTIVTRSGQRAKVVSGEKTYVSSYRVDSKTGAEVPVEDTCLAGTSLEIDPVLGADGVTIDLNLVFRHALEEPTLTDHTITGPVTGVDLTVQLASENQAAIITATTLLSGETRLVGTIPDPKNGSLIMLFIKGESTQ